MVLRAIDLAREIDQSPMDRRQQVVGKLKSYGWRWISAIKGKTMTENENGRENDNQRKATRVDIGKVAKKKKRKKKNRVKEKKREPQKKSKFEQDR